MKRLSTVVIMIATMCLIAVLLTPFGQVYLSNMAEPEAIDNTKSIAWINGNLQKMGAAPISLKVVKISKLSLIPHGNVVIKNNTAFVDFDPMEEDLKLIALESLKVSDSLKKCNLPTIQSREIYDADYINEVKKNGKTTYNYNFGDTKSIKTTIKLPFLTADSEERKSFEELNLDPYNYVDATEFYLNLNQFPDKVFSEATKGKVVCDKNQDIGEVHAFTRP